MFVLKAPTLVLGYASNSRDFPTFGFTSVRNNGQTTRSWTGQCHLCGGEEVLYTTWIETEMSNNCYDVAEANR